MSKPLTFDELEEVSPMYRAFRNQLYEHQHLGRPFDLTALWNSAGRPRGQAPRHYLHRYRDAMRGEVHDQGGGPDGAVLADHPAALHYCMIVDPRIMSTIIEHDTRKRREDPVQAVLDSPDPLTALFTKLDLYVSGMNNEQADRYLIDAAKRAAAGLDVYKEETRVAEVQRAVAFFRPVADEPSPGS